MIAISRARPWPCIDAVHGGHFDSIPVALAHLQSIGVRGTPLRCWNRERRFETMFSRGDNASRHAERIAVGGTTWIECCPRCTKPIADVDGGCTGGCG